MNQALIAAITAPAHDNAAVLRLIDVLAAVDADGDEALALAVLDRIGRRPRLMLRLDEGVRRMSSPAVQAVLAWAERSGAGPIAVALGSMHRYGRTREKAVQGLVARPAPELAGFLVLRTDDWVAPVRKLAQETLSRLAGTEEFLTAAVPMAVKIADRHRGRYAFELVTAAVLAAPADRRRQWATGPDRDLRRLVFDADRQQDRLDLEALTGIALRESDALIRHRAAEAAYAQAVDQLDRPNLHRLATARSGDVRALGFTGLLRLGPASAAMAALDDPAPLVRAIGREAARRAGIDVLAHYRSAEATPGTVAGLAESGSDRDAPMLAALLAHPSGKTRAAAVRGLGRLGAVPVQLVLPLLQDPAAAVVREAAAALAPLVRQVPASVGWELMESARVEVRRAGYRLLTDRDPVTRFRAALHLAADPDARNSERGEMQAMRLAHRIAEPMDHGVGESVLEEIRGAVGGREMELGGLAGRLTAVLARHA